MKPIQIHNKYKQAVNIINNFLQKTPANNLPESLFIVFMLTDIDKFQD